MGPATSAAYRSTSSRVVRDARRQRRRLGSASSARKRASKRAAQSGDAGGARSEPADAKCSSGWRRRAVRARKCSRNAAGPWRSTAWPARRAPAAARRTRSGHRCAAAAVEVEPRTSGRRSAEERVGDAGNVGQRRALRPLGGQQRLGVVGLDRHVRPRDGGQRREEVGEREHCGGAALGRRRLDDERRRAADDALPRRPHVGAHCAERVTPARAGGRARLALARPQQLVQRPPRARRAAGVGRREHRRPRRLHGGAAVDARRRQQQHHAALARPRGATRRAWRNTSSAPTNLVRGRRRRM